MKILAVGDIVGKVGLQKLKDCLPYIVEEKKIDFVIVNGENAADGMGITEKMYNEMLALGVNVVTMGNHTWGKKEIFNFIDDKNIVRPANYSPNNPGKGYDIYECKGKKIAVINLIGRVTMGVLSENPFIVAKDIVNKIKNKVDIIVIDFHGEATAEKIALSYYLDGEITILFGTHTHVQTADERIVDNHCAAISDLGMCGPYHSVIGRDIDEILRRFKYQEQTRFTMAEGKGIFCGCIVEIDDETNQAISIKRIQIKEQ